MKKPLRPLRLVETFSGSTQVLVFKGSNKHPHFTILGACINDLDKQKVAEYLYECDWTDKDSKGWITPEVRCDDFMK